jgi:signal transduction histidine kinase
LEFLQAILSTKYHCPVFGEYYNVSHIFDAFYRVNTDSPGSGLGLSIVKKIVEAHGGKIWVESKPVREAPSVSHCLKGLLRHMRIEKWGSHGRQKKRIE